MPRRQDADPHASKVGQRLLELLREKGLTIEGFGDVSGIAKGHLSNIIRGLSVMTVITIERVARGLEMPAFMLFVSPEDGPREKLVDLIGRMPLEQVQALLASLTAHNEPIRQAQSTPAQH
jgi:transcriptional regulator with XRE-family HTH domain